MAVKDEIKEQQQKLRGKGLKEKFQYFFEYYKWQTIAIIIATFFIVVLTKDVILNLRDPYLYGVFINSSGTLDTESVIPDFAAYANINTAKTPITLETNLSYSSGENNTSIDIYTPTKIMALSESSDVDFMLCDLDAMNNFSSPGYFIDIRQVLTDSQIEQYKDFFYYQEDEELGSIPVGIKVSNSPFLSQTNSFQGDAYFAVFYTSKNKQNAVQFLEFMYEKGTSQ
ncbi:MAG TPA: hypothetical protein VJZ04_06545 [Lachnospiraceae bacterium]|nr:hypothetical protein [Lachnospiraceae bacterium]